jgi:hypothetical protein
MAVTRICEVYFQKQVLKIYLLLFTSCNFISRVFWLIYPIPSLMWVLMLFLSVMNKECVEKVHSMGTFL